MTFWDNLLTSTAQDAFGCQDQVDHPQWGIFWDLYPSILSAWWGNDVTGSPQIYQQMLSLINTMKTLGCSALQDPRYQLEPGTNTPWCAGNLTVGDQIMTGPQNP